MAHAAARCSAVLWSLLFCLERGLFVVASVLFLCSAFIFYFFSPASDTPGTGAHRARDDREEGEADEGGTGRVAEVAAVGGARLGLLRILC